jgi:raffinose/stachyose/melibiose transport system substrate-binding protein
MYYYDISDNWFCIDPNINIGIMPVPSMIKGDTPTFAGGERNTLAIWKDSKHPDEAKKAAAVFCQAGKHSEAL